MDLLKDLKMLILIFNFVMIYIIDIWIIDKMLVLFTLFTVVEIKHYQLKNILIKLGHI